MAWLAFWVVVFAASAVGVVISVNRVRFERAVERDARALFDVRAPSSPHTRGIAALPPPVQRYLRIAIGDGAPAVATVRLRHGGTFRTAPGQRWLPIRGRQFFNADPTGFVWWGRVRIVPGFWIEARDESIRGAGSMLVKAAATWTLANASGPEIDQGALLRLLGEMAWFPTAFADSRYVSWRAIDDRSAEATLRVGGREVRAEFHFGPDGLPTRFTAMRYRDPGNGRSEPTPFVGTYSDFRRHAGLLVPFEIEAAWELREGPFPYARFRVEQLDVNRSSEAELRPATHRR